MQESFFGFQFSTSENDCECCRKCTENATFSTLPPINFSTKINVQTAANVNFLYTFYAFALLHHKAGTFTVGNAGKVLELLSTSRRVAYLVYYRKRLLKETSPAVFFQFSTSRIFGYGRSPCLTAEITAIFFLL